MYFYGAHNRFYILQACSKILEIWHTHPVHIHPDTPSGPAGARSVNYSCHCAAPVSSQDTTTAFVTSFNGDESAEPVTDDVTAINDSTPLVASLSYWISTLPEDCITYRSRVLVGAGCASVEACTDASWKLVGGAACQDETIVRAVPDVFLLSCILFAGTFTVALFFKTLRSTRFFPMQVVH